jgi:hypothetical protein
MGLWSFFRSLWPWRTRPQPKNLRAAEPLTTAGELRLPEGPSSQTSVAATVHSDAAEAPAQGSCAADDEQEDEDEGWEDEDDDELELPDPFISSPPAQLETRDVNLYQRRADARADALSGEHRIYLSMPVGPGSLAEALHQLSAEGMVEAEFVDDGQREPHIHYRPLT